MSEMLKVVPAEYKQSLTGFDEGYFGPMQAAIADVSIIFVGLHINLFYSANASPLYRSSFGWRAPNNGSAGMTRSSKIRSS